MQSTAQDNCCLTKMKFCAAPQTPSINTWQGVRRSLYPLFLPFWLSPRCGSTAVPKAAQRTRSSPRNQQVAPLQPGAVCKLPAWRAAKPSIISLSGHFAPFASAAWEDSHRGDSWKVGHWKCCQPLLYYFSPADQGGPGAAAVIGTTTEQVKQAKGKQDWGYPRKRKGISAMHLNILWLFSNIRNYGQFKWLI